MSKELSTYGEHLEQLNRRFPEQDMLTRKDLMSYTGMCNKTVKTRFPFEGHFITKVRFARLLSEEDRV